MLLFVFFHYREKGWDFSLFFLFVYFRCVWILIFLIWFLTFLGVGQKFRCTFLGGLSALPKLWSSHFGHKTSFIVCDERSIWQVFSCIDFPIAHPFVEFGGGGLIFLFGPWMVKCFYFLIEVNHLMILHPIFSHFFLQLFEFLDVHVCLNFFHLLLNKDSLLFSGHSNYILHILGGVCDVLNHLCVIIFFLLRLLLDFTLQVFDLFLLFWNCLFEFEILLMAAWALFLEKFDSISELNILEGGNVHWESEF